MLNRLSMTLRLYTRIVQKVSATDLMSFQLTPVLSLAASPALRLSLQPKNLSYRPSKLNSRPNRPSSAHLNLSPTLHPSRYTRHPIQPLQPFLTSSLALLLMQNSVPCMMKSYACRTSSKLRMHLSRSVSGELLSLSKAVCFPIYCI